MSDESLERLRSRITGLESAVKILEDANVDQYKKGLKRARERVRVLTCAGPNGDNPVHNAAIKEADDAIAAELAALEKKNAD